LRSGARLVGEGLGKRDLFVGEGSLLNLVDVDHADREAIAALGLGRPFMPSGTASNAVAAFGKVLQRNPGQRAVADLLRDLR
jgi:hypothetical protein